MMCHMRAMNIAAGDGTPLALSRFGTGPDVLLLSGGPGCVQYLAEEHLAPPGHTSWFLTPRGVSPSEGGPHGMTQAIADIEDVRRQLDVDRWIVVGHSWGSDLAVRYALDHPSSVAAVIGVAGHGLHLDRPWSEAYELGRQAEQQPVAVDWVPAVHEALWYSFRDWIHEPELFRRLADSPVPMNFIAAGEDIRPSWPLQQLSELAPRGSFSVIDGVAHDFWAAAPDVWVDVINTGCAQACANPG